MHNMCSATPDTADLVDATSVAVLAWLDRWGAPRSCAVTPYRIADEVVVTSTLALLGKVRALSRDPRAALLVGGQQVRGVATVTLDTTSRSFDTMIREQERAKYPPARALLAIPGHRRLLWWYVGRAFIRVPLEFASPAPGSDRVTATIADVDGPRIVPLDQVDGISAAAVGATVKLGGDVPDGRVCVLVHEERDDFAELLQLTLSGTVTDGYLTVAQRTGTLEPSKAGMVAQLRQLRALGRSARQSRSDISELAVRLGSGW